MVSAALNTVLQHHALNIQGVTPNISKSAQDLIDYQAKFNKGLVAGDGKYFEFPVVLMKCLQELASGTPVSQGTVVVENTKTAVKTKPKVAANEGGQKSAQMSTSSSSGVPQSDSTSGNQTSPMDSSGVKEELEASASSRVKEELPVKKGVAVKRRKIG